MRADIQLLPPDLREAVRSVALRLGAAGHRAWMVGGAARDLLRGVTPKDVDLVSAARPEEVEALFERTVGVGRSFGIVIVRSGGRSLEVATFRTEGAYSDGRRPDEVRFGDTPAEDAERRDFTVNAIFVDPLTGEILDPTGGREDLVAGRLRCVGAPRDRFGEDGLRILRLGRFAAQLDLAVEPATLDAARAGLDALRGVSPERVRGELERVFDGPDPRRALGMLAEVGALERVLPGWEAASRVSLERRLEALGALGPAPGPVRGFAVLLEPDPEGEPRLEEGLGLLVELRPSRELRDRVGEVWSLRRELRRLARRRTATSERVLALREGPWREAIDVERGWRGVAGEDVGELEALGSWRRECTEEELRPEPLLAPEDLEAAGVPRGPRWGELLKKAEIARLDGIVTDREGALRWLEAQVPGE